MKPFASFAAGLIFAIGLVVSGLANPAKVQGFLDIAGSWDPSLAFTMAGAVLTTAIGYRLVLAGRKPVLAESFNVPAISDIDGSLIAGSAIFGMGWGLVGLCPGPAIAALGIGGTAPLVFVAAMLAGMALARALTASGTPADDP